MSTGLPDRIRAIIDESGLSQAEFAQRLGVGTDTVNRWANGHRAPQRSSVRDLAEFCGVSPGEMIRHLFDGAPLPARRENGYTLPDSGSSTTGASGHRLPVINKVAAGYGRETTDLGYPAGIADADVDAYGITDDEAFAVVIDGDSMAGDLKPGDLAICCPNAPFKDGRIYYVRLERDDENLVRRVFVQEDGAALMLVPTNSNQESLLLPRDEVAMLARVVELRRAVP